MPHLERQFETYKYYQDKIAVQEEAPEKVN